MAPLFHQDTRFIGNERKWPNGFPQIRYDTTRGFIDSSTLGGAVINRCLSKKSHFSFALNIPISKFKEYIYEADGICPFTWLVDSIL